jgi:four helix bundle protein
MNKFDLEERTEDLGVEIVVFCRLINKNAELRILSNQLLRSGTSVGANYREANGAGSGKDFRNKIFICKKEAKESIYWLKVIERSSSDYAVKAEALRSECEELERIFGKISTSLNNKKSA